MAENTPGQTKRGAFSQKSRRDKQNAARFRPKHSKAEKNDIGWYFPNAKAGSKQKIVRSPTRFCQTAKRRCLPGRIFSERQNAGPCPDTFSPNGKMPFLVPAHFPQTAKCRCLSQRIFSERQKPCLKTQIGVLGCNPKT
ncbi:MAG: hypothetical protein K2O09_06265, partial [Treponemataceae bacterium]|nr:hypothetical protein [Treponemataceae bacterium]